MASRGPLFFAAARLDFENALRNSRPMRRPKSYCAASFRLYCRQALGTLATLMTFVVTHQYRLLVAIIAAGACLRFYGLSWGAPYHHFHIDEHFVFVGADLLRESMRKAATLLAFSVLHLRDSHFFTVDISLVF